MPSNNFVYAFRALRKSPVFAITAVLTIALGIGAATAIFSVTNAVLLRPIPYKDADRLVIAAADLRKRDVRDIQYSNEDFIDLRDGTKSSFEDFAGVFTILNIVPRQDQSPEQVKMAIVTTNFFHMVGAKIELGRDFTDADGLPQPAPPPPGAAQPGAPAPPRLPVIAILSHEYFERHFGGNPATLGRPLTTNPGSPLVVGVLAPGFELYFPPSAGEQARPDIWIANRLTYNNANRNAFSIRAIGKLKPGVTVERAQAEVDAQAADTRSKYIIERTAGYYIRVEPLRKHLVAEARPAILALMGAVVFLLLIACSNVANLLLVRASLRERELAVRAALGGSWWVLVRQMLAEALVLAFFGAAGGLLLAYAGIQELRAIAPGSLPRLDTIRIDAAVLAFTALAGLAAAALFGLMPAWRASRPNLISVLRGSSRNAGLAGGGLMRNVVVVLEVALSFILLIGSGLMFRSFLELQRINPGFEPHGLLTFQLLGGRPRTTPEQRAAYLNEVRQRLEAIPGVHSATASFPFPLAGGFSPIRWGTAEALGDFSKFQAADFQLVLPNYFEVMHTPVIAGRAFTDADNQPGRNVVVVDQMLAAKAFHGESAVGKRILIRLRTPEPEWVEILGVVAHQRDTSLADPGREQVYFPNAFVGSGAARDWALRTAGDPGSYTKSVRAEIAKFDPALLISDVQPADALVERAQASTRFSLLLIGVFAGIAVLLAGVGLYGVLSTVVRQRTAEIGVRVALGAGPTSVFRLVVGHGLRLSAAGIAVGLLAALELTKLMNTMLVGIKATDPMTFVAMAALFIAIAAVSSWLPARRAAGLDPTAALREE